MPFCYSRLCNQAAVCLGMTVDTVSPVAVSKHACVGSAYIHANANVNVVHVPAISEHGCSHIKVTVAANWLRKHGGRCRSAGPTGRAPLTRRL